MGGDGFIAHYQWRLPVHVPIELATVSMPFCYHCGSGLGAMHHAHRGDLECRADCDVCALAEVDLT